MRVCDLVSASDTWRTMVIPDDDVAHQEGVPFGYNKMAVFTLQDYAADDDKPRVVVYRAERVEIEASADDADIVATAFEAGETVLFDYSLLKFTNLASSDSFRCGIALEGVDFSGGVNAGDKLLIEFGPQTGPKLATPVALTDSTGGTANNTLVAIGATNTGDRSADINNNFADLAAKLNELRTIMLDGGAM